MLVAGLKHRGGNNKNMPSNSENATGDADDLGQKNERERGNGERTRKDGRKSWRWTREVRVTAVMKSSE